MRDTIKMAREAGFNVKLFKPPVITAQHSNGSWVSVGDELKAFEALVRADERNKVWSQKHWTEYEQAIAKKAVVTEQKRIVNLLMIQHEAAKWAHNYWHVAANLIQADVASDT